MLIITSICLKVSTLLFTASNIHDCIYTERLLYSTCNIRTGDTPTQPIWVTCRFIGTSRCGISSTRIIYEFLFQTFYHNMHTVSSHRWSYYHRLATSSQWPVQLNYLLCCQHAGHNYYLSLSLNLSLAQFCSTYPSSFEGSNLPCEAGLSGE